MIKDLVKKNRSCRGYDRSRKVKRKELLDMVDCARLCASSVNKQPLKYFVTAEREIADKITAHVQFGAMLAELHLPLKDTEPPAYIVICQDTSINPVERSVLKDVGIAAQTITLRAAEMGLSSCMIGAFRQEDIGKLLFLPDGVKAVLIIAIGKSIEKAKIVEIDNGEDTAYYREEDGTHCVPKRKLEDVILN